MKKYSDLILESLLPRNTFVYKLGMLREFLIYKCGMFEAINKLLKDNSTPKNFNSEYQYPLSILYKTGKYQDIKNNGDSFYTDRISNFNKVLDESGNWHPVNKLNTNSFDQAELLYDLFNSMGIYEEIGSIQGENDIKNWLVNFKNTNDLYTLIKENLNFKEYTRWNRKNSISGEVAENKVREVLESKGCKVLYQGGDGDVIDMIYGVDLIVSKNDKIYTVQIKTREDAAKKALDSTNKAYSNIDWFCSPFEFGVKIFTKGNPSGKLVN